ncbi:microtubule-actin cross-linking factor 1, isoforms 6/7-like [Daphnia carinata]|uniref:microtubule-actin cross-linking factor 1, isoforms 6/7-like n=1 Tax=Daphnia carinata TaxID=120202 RepID=UPI00257BCDBF|nr:microtubule-actin cross-linking factor 1, isoforms 6/7-like [Daphnia carinata]
MNTFKLVLAVCSVVAVTTCSGQYLQSGRPSWEMPTTPKPWAPIKTETETKYQTLPVPANTNIPASAFPKVTQQICTCTAVSESTAAGMIEKYQQPSSGAATAQQAAPAKQESAVAQQFYSAQPSVYSPAASSQQHTTQAPAHNGYYTTTAAPVELVTPAQHARPAYASPAKATRY